MAALSPCSLDCLPENVLLDILSYLNVRELIRNSRVCRHWCRLVKDQRLWRSVDLSTWKQVTSRMLWILLRRYLGHGLRFLCVRGLLLSARKGVFLSESWLQTLSSKSPRLHRLRLLNTDLRGLPSCFLLPPSLKVLELHNCEVPPDFFTHSPSGSVVLERTPSSVAIQTLLLNNVPSFTDHHLRSLGTWPELSRLVLRDVIRVTVSGLKCCIPPGTQTLSHLRHLELATHSRMQMLSLGLAEGWPGLESLSLGDKEVNPCLLWLHRLSDLRSLRLHNCRLMHALMLRSCRGLTTLHSLDFDQVEIVENEVRNGEQKSVPDPLSHLKQELNTLLPTCAIQFTDSPQRILSYSH